MSASIITAIVWIPNTDRDTYTQIKNNLYEWRQSWKHHIQLSFVDNIHHADGLRRRKGGTVKQRLKVAVVVTSRESLDNLPNGAKQQVIPDLKPIWGLRANVRDVTYSSKGVEVKGSKHFEPGAEVYPHKQFSGDGYERVYVTGCHKDTGKFISIMMPTERLENWRAELIEDPIVIFRMQDGNQGWDGDNIEEEEAEMLAAAMNQRISCLTSG